MKIKLKSKLAALVVTILLAIGAAVAQFYGFELNTESVTIEHVEAPDAGDAPTPPAQATQTE